MSPADLRKRLERLEAAARPAPDPVDAETEAAFAAMTDQQLDQFLTERMELAAQDPAVQERWARMDEMSLEEIEAMVRNYCQPPATRGAVP
jgi:hypothetical protein